MALTPVSITIPGSDFTAFAASVNPPNSGAASYLGQFGGDDASALKNQVTGLAATKVGAIAHGANYSTFTRDAGIDTGVAFSTPFTFYAVCGRPATFQGVMGCYNSADGAYRQSVLADMTGNSVGIFLNNVAGQRYAPVVPGPGLANYNFLFCQFDGATMQAGYGWTDGSGNRQIAKASSAYAYAPAAKNLRVGATGYGSANNNVNFTAAAGFPSVLTPEQLLEEYTFHKSRLATLGLTLN